MGSWRRRGGVGRFLYRPPSPSSARCVRLILQLLLLLALVLLYSHQEELLGEVKAIQAKLFPPSLPPAPTWTATRAALATLPPMPTIAASKTSATPGCHLPLLDPWHPAILPYVSEKPSLVCATHQKSLVYIEVNSLNINSTALKELGLLRSQVSCNFAYIALESSDVYQFLPEVELVGARASLSSNYSSVLVTCRKVGGLHSFWWQQWPFPPLYTNILPYLPKRRAKSDKTSFGDLNKKYSVAILLIDSLSQLSLKRYLPKANDAFQALGGIVFKGHHKVGHNSWPNVMALLGGELQPPWPLDQGRSSCYYIDLEHKPILLKEFGAEGWTTLFLEDFQLYGLVREGRMAFSKPPADHYYRSTYWPITKERGLRNRLVGKADNYACQQELPAHTHQFRILRDLLLHQDGPTFAYVHLNEYTHNDLTMARHYDQPLKQLVTELSKAGALNDTFFVLLADHGFQRGDNPFTLTEQGKVENNMPAFVLLPPTSLAAEQPEMVASLLANADHLTSHLDLYVTLREVLAMGSKEPLVDPTRGLPGKSLLHPVERRGCGQAGVPPQFCSCTEGRVRLETSSMEKVARALLSDTDTFLLPLGLCQPLKLAEVKEATLRPKAEGQKFSVLELQLAVTVSQAVFQATISLSTSPPHLHMLTLTRMDWYSDTSSCLPSDFPHLRPYCICY